MKHGIAKDDHLVTVFDEADGCMVKEKEKLRTTIVSRMSFVIEYLLISLAQEVRGNSLEIERGSSSLSRSTICFLQGMARDHDVGVYIQRFSNMKVISCSPKLDKRDKDCVLGDPGSLRVLWEFHRTTRRRKRCT